MSTETYGETDLRDALASLSLDDGREPDVTDLRARILASVGGTDAPHADGEVLDLQPARTRRLRPLRRTGWFAAAAAAVVALLAVAAVVFVGQGKDVSPADVYRDVVPNPYPGTTFVAAYEGHGPRTIVVPDRRVPENFQWTIWGDCSGTGAFRFADALVAGGRCRPGAIGHDITDPLWDRTVRVRADEDVSWRIVATIAPKPLTNGTVVGPDDLEGFTAPALYTGTGNKELRVTGPTVRDGTIKLLCRGSGVQLLGPSAKGVRAGSPLATNTCFSGFLYQWQNVRVRQGEAMYVAAKPGTTWRFVITP
ncbi:hypothetical protein [Jatrophihabitans fulvus]